MKNLILVFIVLPIFCLAQNSNLPLDNSSVWRIKRTICNNGSFAKVNDYRSYINGDTVINSITYKKMYTAGIRYEVCLDGSTICDSMIYPYSDEYQAAYRNENNKVFLIQKDYNDEMKIFDFNLMIGDTFPAVGPNPIIIESIDSVLIGNKYHKQFLSNTNFWVIEGLGSSLG